MTQGRECTISLISKAKTENISVILVGHINKDGNIAGPKILEHMVDAVLYFEGERRQQYRIIRAIKNRYGSTNEIGVFEMTDRGLVEIPMGKTLRDVIFDIGGGIRGGKEFKGVQLGGPSGGCIPVRLADTVIDYKALSATGAIMGSGGMVVMDESTCMVRMAKFFLDFTTNESCGKCVPCRIGTMRLRETLERICQGNGRDGDIELLEELCAQIKDGSLCGLGQTAPNPVLTTLRYFRDEYEAHIKEHRCPAGECPELISYHIDSDKCRGCTLCSKKCPVGAISGEVKKPHKIDSGKCIKCGSCKVACRFDAIFIK